MKSELLQQVLGAEKAVKAEGKGAYLMSDEVEVTVILEVGHESMSIAKVRRISMQPDLITVETHKGERYYLGSDTPVRGLRFAESESTKLRGAGFTKG